MRTDITKKEYSKRYREANKEHINEYNKKYQRNNKKHLKEYRRKYYKTSNGRKTIHKGMLKRNGRMNEVIHNFNYHEWWEKVLETEGICPECKEDVGIYQLTMDHIIPISKAPKGFIYTIEGIKPLCKLCNSSKGNSNDEYDLMVEAIDTTVNDFVEGKNLGEILKRIGGVIK